MSNIHEQIQYKKHIKGLDSVRFIAAMWVVFSHGVAFPLIAGIDHDQRIGFFISAIYNNIFCGVSAVIVFFVISGFVIHYPYFYGKKFNYIEFFIRRYMRIGIPLVVAIIISINFHARVDNNITTIHDVLWSLVAELIYYTIYPIFRIIRKKIDLRIIILIAYVLSLSVILTNPYAGNYHEYGYSLTWLLGLPCWLLGCLLAETDWDKYTNNSKVLPLASLNRWRISIWILGAICSVLRFHSPIGYPWTLNLFAIVVFFWLRKEIQYFNFNVKITNNKYFEWCGIWSYSIYITHPLSINILLNYIKLPNLGYLINWTVEITFILLFAYLFYSCVEKPSHVSARLLARINF